MVDVRDVAELLVRSLFTEKAGGERFLVVGHRFTWQQVCKYSLVMSLGRSSGLMYLLSQGTL